MVKGSRSEEDWRAEDDFRTLTSAREVEADAHRLAKAKRAGRRIVKQEEKALKTKRSIAAPRRRGRRG